MDMGKLKNTVDSIVYTSVFEIKTPVNSILWKVLWRAAVAFGSVDRKLYM